MDLVALLKERVPNAGPKATQSIINAQRRLEMIRVKNPEEAEIFSNQLAGAISNREDPSSILEGIGRSYGMRVGKQSTAPAQEESKYPEDLARGISDLLEMSDANAIRINPALVRDAAESLTKNDAKSQKSIYGRIKEEFDSKSKIQSEEDKDLITLANGIQVLQGKKSGTRYSVDGMPISSGEVNTKPFNESLWSGGGGMVGGDKVVSQFGTSPELAGAVIDPEVYASPVTQKETNQKEKEKNILRAGGLYREGKREEALAVLNSVGISGMYGGGMMPQELDSYFQGIEQNQPSATTTEENKPQSFLTPEQKKRLEESRKKRLEAEAAN